MRQATNKKTKKTQNLNVFKYKRKSLKKLLNYLST